MKNLILKKNEKSPFVIGIAGESGVGKSTLTEIISLYFGYDNTTILSTDDLHKWERNHPEWENFTHLNPLANNLDLGDDHLYKIINNNSISRSIYNHYTGKFDEPIEIIPKKNIINEGLHAYYTDFAKNNIDLKIFIETDEDLRIHWKIIRDTQERGYTYEKVLSSINKRKKDSETIKRPQLSSADIIINFSSKEKIKKIGDKEEEISIIIDVVDKTNKYENLCQFIKNYFNDLNNFINISETIGRDIELCQDTGGNISIKFSENYLLIKSSGFSLKDVNNSKSFSVFNFKNFKNKNISNDFELHDSLKEFLAIPKFKRPSMETGFHVYLDKYVIHLHPIYLTLILCLQDSENIIKNLYSNYDYEYVQYNAPGYNLFNTIKNVKNKNIYFLENHGLILSFNDLNKILNTLNEINNIAKQFVVNFKLLNKFEYNKNINTNPAIDFLFPDSVIFNNNPLKKETFAVADYILNVGPKMGTLRYLKREDVEFLNNLEAESYRKNV
jgi:uridine kinase/ribulose-5-phosphate 4-epimerase/fuculose-1-phosphate aldolase